MNKDLFLRGSFPKYKDPAGEQAALLLPAGSYLLPVYAASADRSPFPLHLIPAGFSVFFQLLLPGGQGKKESGEEKRQGVCGKSLF